MFIASQICVIVSYLLLFATYTLKKRSVILIFSFAALFFNGCAFFLLSAWSAFAMMGVAILRNIIFMVQIKNNQNQKIINLAILIFLFVLIIVLSIFTYQGFFSLFSIFGTLVYTFSLWQKNTRVYKYLGVVSGFFWISYNVFVKNVFGVVCEVLFMFSIFVAIIIEIKKSHKKTEK